MAKNSKKLAYSIKNQTDKKARDKFWINFCQIVGDINFLKLVL